MKTKCFFQTTTHRVSSGVATTILSLAAIAAVLTLPVRGDPFAWGYGYLGDGTIAPSYIPVAVDTSGVLAGKTVTAIAAGSYHTMALTSEGNVYAWGNNSFGQLGDGTATPASTPVAVDMSGVLAGKTVTAVAAGNHHTVAVTSEGKVYAWGYNVYGQLGNGTFNNRSTPVVVDMNGVLVGKIVTAVAAGNHHTVAVTSEGKVYAWGYNSHGQLGDGTNTSSNTPVATDMSGVLAGKTVTAIAAGLLHTVALTSEGKVYAWGDNYRGHLGDGSNTNRNTPVATDMSGVLAGKTVIAVSAGDYTVALASEGKVYAWGYNAGGQLGDGTTSDRSTPVAVDMSGVLAGKTVTAIAAGSNHTVALTSERKVYAWGYNSAGQLGDGTSTDRLTPVAVDMSGVLSSKGVTAISAGDYHTVALAVADLSTQPPTLTAPASDSTHTTTVAVDFTLPEAALPGSVQLTFGMNVLTLAASQETAGPHSFTFDPLHPMMSAEIASGSAVPDGVYTVTLSYQDQWTNPAGTASAMNVTINTPTQPAVMTLPVPGTYSRALPIEYFLPEDALPGSVAIRFHETSTPILLVEPSEETAGLHSFVVDPYRPRPSPFLRGGSGIIPNGVYQMRVTYQDAMGNPEVASNVIANVRIDWAGPDGGSFVVSPPNPVGPATVLTATFAGWSDDVGPITYAVLEDATVIVPDGMDAAPTFVLPEGVHWLTGRITDAMGNFTDTGPVLVNVLAASTDTMTPVVILTSPPTSTVAGPFTIAGTVKENFGLVRFTVKLNGVPLALDAPLVFAPNVAVPWSVSGVVPENGANTIVVEALDYVGRLGTKTKTVTYVNPAVAGRAGTYIALMQPSIFPDVNTTGLVTVTVTTSGSFTGSALLGGVKVAFTGTLRSDGTARFKPALGTTFALIDKTEYESYLGALALSVTDPDGLAGTLWTNPGGMELANFAGERAPYSKSNLVPAVPYLNLPVAGPFTSGRYAVSFRSKEQMPPRDHALYPQGHGYATLTLTNTGSVSLTGYLADGTTYSVAGKLRADGSVALFRQLYRKEGALGGELRFADLADTDASGTDFLWLRPMRPLARYYSAGWPDGLRVDAVATKYASPASLDFGQGAVDTINGNANLVFTDGLLGAPIIKPVCVNPGPVSAGQVKRIPASGATYTMSLATSTGILSGTFVHPVSATETFRGILLDKGANQGGYGYFLSAPVLSYGASGQGGGVFLDPAGP